MKNIILLTLSVNDFFFHKENPKINKEDQEKFISQMETIVTNPKYTGVVNISIPADSNRHVNVFKNRKPSSVSKLVLYTDESLLHGNNELTILTSDQNEELVYHASHFDFIFPPKDYEIHVCGLDVNGLMVPSIKELLNLGYTVKLYSGSIKPFRNTYKQISKISHPEFTYCSAKAAL